MWKKNYKWITVHMGVLLFPVMASAAMLSITPASGLYTVNDEFTATVLLDTAGVAVDGVDLHFLRYDTARLELLDSDSTRIGVQIGAGSLMPNTVKNNVDIPEGKIDFSQHTNGGAKFMSTGQEVLATIQFRVKSAGTANLSFDYTPNSTTDTNVVANVTELLTSVSGASYSFSAPSTPPPTSGGGGGGGGSSGGGGGGGSIFIPPAPSAFLAFGGPDQVVLIWKNPTVSSFVRSRLIRKEGAPPNTVDDGIVVYEGIHEEYTDTDINAGVAYFYAIYSLDHALRASEIRYAGTGAGTSLGDLSEVEIMQQIVDEKAKIVVTPPILPSGGTRFTYRFTLPLQMESVGEEVRQLQILLNLLGFTISPSGHGSRGNETSYFGGLTRNAVSRFQAQYLPNIPTGDRGLVGPSTRAKLNELAVTVSLQTSPPVSVAGIQVAYTFTRNLTVGNKGEDVLQLQKFLNAQGFQLAASGPGSPGSETDFFGPITRAAVTRLQEAYTAEILIPVGLSRGTGYFGPSTRAHVHVLMNSGAVPAQSSATTQSLQEQIRQAQEQVNILLQQIQQIQ